MPTSNSTRRNLTLPGAQATDNRLQDIQGVKAALEKIDTELHAIRENICEKITVIDGGNAGGGGSVSTLGGGLAALDGSAEAPESWTPGQLGFSFSADAYTPGGNFSF